MAQDTEEEKVVDLDCITTLDIPVERILERAARADLESVVVIGWTKEGDYYFASSHADGADVLWLIEVTKKKLLSATTC